MAKDLIIGKGGRQWRLSAEVAGRQLKLVVIEPPNKRTPLIIPVQQEEELIAYLRRGFAAARAAGELAARSEHDV